MKIPVIQLIALVGSVLFLFIILWSVRQKKLKEAYALLWLFIGIVMLFFSVWPSCLHLISKMIGIYYPPATLFLALLSGIVLLLFQYALIRKTTDGKVEKVYR